MLVPRHPLAEPARADALKRAAHPALRHADALADVLVRPATLAELHDQGVTLMSRDGVDPVGHGAIITPGGDKARFVSTERSPGILADSA